MTVLEFDMSELTFISLSSKSVAIASFVTTIGAPIELIVTLITLPFRLGTGFGKL